MKSILSVFLLVGPLFAQAGAPNPVDSGVPVRSIVTVEPKAGPPPQLGAADVLVYQNGRRVRVSDFTRLGPDRDGMQLWILIDDGADMSLSTQFNDLKSFIAQQPAAEQIGIGYLQNGMVRVARDLTTDHQAAQNAIRLPLGIPGISASPYLAVAGLIKKWPATDRPREILLMTSGVDPDFGAGPGNPYLNQATDAALRAHVVVHAIWYGSAGHAGHSFALTLWGDTYLSQLTEDTGGEFFWQGDINPVSFRPFLDRLDREFSEQYWLTFPAKSVAKPSFEKIRIRTEMPGVSIVAPARVWVDPNSSRRPTG